MLKQLVQPRSLQRGGTLMGIIIGLVVGLAAALAVAVYVTKAPISFAHKTQARTPDQVAQEAKKNKDWDPNTPLYGKNPVKAASNTVPVPTPAAAPPAAAPAAPPTAVPPPAAAKEPAPPAASKSKDPLGDLAKAKTQPAAAGTSSDPFVYFVQSGAYRTQTDADAQRAKLAMLSFDAKVTEREQSGYTVFRVRVGPLDRKEEADRIKEKLESSGIESVLVRVNR